MRMPTANHCAGSPGPTRSAIRSPARTSPRPRRGGRGGSGCSRAGCRRRTRWAPRQPLRSHSRCPAANSSSARPGWSQYMNVEGDQHRDLEAPVLVGPAAGRPPGRCSAWCSAMCAGSPRTMASQARRPDDVPLGEAAAGEAVGEPGQPAGAGGESGSSARKASHMNCSACMRSRVRASVGARVSRATVSAASAIRSVWARTWDSR